MNIFKIKETLDDKYFFSKIYRIQCGNIFVVVDFDNVFDGLDICWGADQKQLFENHINYL